MGSRFQNSLQSNFDQTAKISKSVFISNFPDDCSSRDLWKVCSGYGTVVDVLIPNKRSKAGKRFAFVRFIKVLKLCGGVIHLAKDCPNKGNRSSGMSNEFGKRSTGIENIARGQVTKFSSGDDLEDDFTMIDDGKEKKTSEPNADAASNAAAAKSKKKQGTKVVNFMG
ncbi:RNA-directed DNA polymerase, eukaryota, nucleotide-binding alpha-beta plait domain protein [Tanacetum coccineum]